MKELIEKYKRMRDEWAERLNSGELSEYSHTVHVHKYNLILIVIKDLEQMRDK